MRARVGIALALVLLAAGGIWLARNTGGCAAARLDGTLIEQPPGELALEPDGAEGTYPIDWPGWYGLRRLDDGRLAIADWFGVGDVKAADGDHVGLGGGESVDEPGAWGVCGIAGSMDRIRR